MTSLNFLKFRRCKLHSGKLTSQWNMSPLKMYFRLKTGIFQPAMLVYQRVVFKDLEWRPLHGNAWLDLFFLGDGEVKWNELERVSWVTSNDSRIKVGQDLNHGVFMYIYIDMYIFTYIHTVSKKTYKVKRHNMSLINHSSELTISYPRKSKIKESVILVV